MHNVHIPFQLHVLEFIPLNLIKHSANCVRLSIMELYLLQLIITIWRVRDYLVVGYVVYYFIKWFSHSETAHTATSQICDNEILLRKSIVTCSTEVVQHHSLTQDKYSESWKVEAGRCLDPLALIPQCSFYRLKCSTIWKSNNGIKNVNTLIHRQRVIWNSNYHDNNTKNPVRSKIKNTRIPTNAEFPTNTPNHENQDTLSIPEIFLGPKTFISIPQKQHLTIAVDATPRTIGGYCVNFFDSKINFYSVPSNEMPWVLRDQSVLGSPAEFEMKNLLCALLLWCPVVLKYKNVVVYTDNTAILGHCVYSSRVHDFVRHLQDCKGVSIVNSGSMYVNSKDNKKQFLKFIQPADHLSRNRVAKFVDAIHEIHGPSFKYDEMYCIEEEIFEKVNQDVINWTRNACRTCGFALKKTGSFMQANS